MPVNSDQRQSCPTGCPRAARLLFATIMTVPWLGCSGGALESQVSGTVSLDGKAIGPGVVVFALDGSAKPAIGAIQSDGTYSMKTSRQVGLVPGHYQIAVSIREQPVNMQPGDRPPPGKSLIPEKYESVETAGLARDVQPGLNVVDIELQSE